LVGRAFTPPLVDALRPTIESCVTKLLDRVAGNRSIDAIADFASPLPTAVIGEMLGVPAEVRKRLSKWSVVMSASLEPTAFPALLDSFSTAQRALFASLKQIVAERRREPRDDLISRWVAAQEQGDVLSDREIVSLCNLTFFLGYETTVDFLGNALNALLQHPEQLALLRAQPALIETAVEELLRFDSPVQSNARVALRDLEIAGRTIRAGQTVVALLGAANRDPVEFPHPDVLDITRRPNRHVAFGRGIHACLGALLARLEARVALPAILDRFPNLHLSREPARRRPTFVTRGFSSLPLAIA
jgi:cytochrome P450